MRMEIYTDNLQKSKSIVAIIIVKYIYVYWATYLNILLRTDWFMKFFQETTGEIYKNIWD